MQSPDMKHMEFIDAVAAEDLRELRRKEETYRGSWKKDGGRSAWMNVKRKIDRLTEMMRRPETPHGFNLSDLDDATSDGGDVTLDASLIVHLRDCYVADNIFAAIRGNPSGEDGSPLAEVRDLRRYLLLIEAEMVARSVVTLVATDGDKDKVEYHEALAKSAMTWGVRPEKITVITDGDKRKRPTIAELDAILNEGDTRAMHINNDGTVTVEKFEGGSTLSRGNQIEADFYALKAQEWACEPAEAKRRVELLFKRNIGPQGQFWATELSTASESEGETQRMRPGTPADGGHHARQERIEDGETDVPLWPYIAVYHVGVDPSGAFLVPSDKYKYYNADRRCIPAADIEHLPRLDLELNHKEWTDTLPEYRGMYVRDEEAAKWRLRPEYVEAWGRHP